VADRLRDFNRSIGRPDKLSTIFGRRITKVCCGGLKTRIADHHLGNPVIRSEYKDSSVRQYVHDFDRPDYDVRTRPGCALRWAENDAAWRAEVGTSGTFDSAGLSTGTARRPDISVVISMGETLLLAPLGLANFGPSTCLRKGRHGKDALTVFCGTEQYLPAVNRDVVQPIDP